ncbi:hypothetical protein ACFQXB_13850 [Plastorhodobacter daqingensis]|uniref:Response regulatory domain-containing protein n=1 Tax=Plastorhodobacter daqingensis TaxID=1387281 RepID=A0ABW2UKQ6_9RHOB
MNSADPTLSGVFVLVEADQLVLDDLAEAIREICPSCEVHAFRTACAAARALDVIPAVTGAILSVGADQLETSGLTAEVAARGGQILMLEGPGVRAAAEKQGCPVIARPFNAAMLHDAVSGICARAPSPQC